jgi:hypothetical protein
MDADGHRVACHLYSPAGTDVVSVDGTTPSSTTVPGSGERLRLIA